MNAVEIEEAITALAEQPFDAAEFGYAFLECFDNSAARSKKLRSGASNKSDLDGVLQASNNGIHIKTCATGQVPETIAALKDSKATQTKRNKVRFVLATDGDQLEAEDLVNGDVISCNFTDLANHSVFFWPIAGLSKTRQLVESEFDIRATLRLNKLYVTLRTDNPEWGKAERSHDMNHFMARLIFLFFAEDTDILNGDDLFTATIEQWANRDGSNTHEIISEIFRAMDTPPEDRKSAQLRNWADDFPYVNGGLFSGSTETPKFSRIAQRYLIQIGNLNWKKINPDIFGSMIQAVADEDERSQLGMHYTSVPNILKVLNPLFLDDLREHLARAGDSPQKLLNLRKRMANIRVFDPACGSGNFLVIAYKQMREIEAEINRRRQESTRKSDISIQNFRGIELRDFSAEIARLALIIAEYQCDVIYRGQKNALLEFLPLDKQNWITCGNALQLDWLSVCPPTGTGVAIKSDDLFRAPLDQNAIDFENEGGETYICGNPPFKGRNKKEGGQRLETQRVFSEYPGSFASLDYVSNWLMKSAQYSLQTSTRIGLVATNSICQGEQVALLWPLLFKLGLRISFAHTSFQWSNLASDKAGVTVVIVGLSLEKGSAKLFEDDQYRIVEKIGPYLIPNSVVSVSKSQSPISNLPTMYLGNMAKDDGNLIFHKQNGLKLINEHGVSERFIRPFFGSEELIHSKPRSCLWISDSDVEELRNNGAIAEIFERVVNFRIDSKAESTRKMADVPHRFVQLSAGDGEKAIIIPRVSSENRQFLPVDYFDSRPVIGDKCFALYDAPLWNMALIASRLHWVWIGTVCVRMRTDFSYSNTLGWNTFPVPPLTEKNKADLTRCAEDILLAREAHFPATIADLYAPDAMPENLRAAHEKNDETLERIYIGRRFKNDTERLEKLFEMYTKMTTEVPVEKLG